ncbi:IclR family transcriptional regulator [Sphingosinicella sp. BN140058]|uniref:IclR family transcriptional regulator n=1 Tax=Sphingosinicella sp. BN140058 TaxID=1892855 RepID=UPI0010122363|nr:IclR family transcriptional regulator [Sphingosinicella sp. BN140058]QAY76709.1 IclR family transcriptional regulator [Sphingosinicella sp. BN140058]
MAEADHQQGGARPSATRYSAPALEKGFDVVELLAGEPSGLTISEIAARLGLTISQIFRMIVVMERRGWLFKDAQSDRYRVSYKVLELAYRATPAQQLAHVATPVMHALAEAAEQSCHLVVQHGDRAMILLRQENPGAIGLSVRLGTLVDLVASSSGHVLLAFSAPEALEATLSRCRFPPHLGEEALRDVLARVRMRGFETMASAKAAGVRDISYPVFGFDGGVVAALTVPFLEFIDGSQAVDFDAVQHLIAGSAQRISEALGWVDAR